MVYLALVFVGLGLESPYVRPGVPLFLLTCLTSCDFLGVVAGDCLAFVLAAFCGDDVGVLFSGVESLAADTLRAPGGLAKAGRESSSKAAAELRRGLGMRLECCGQIEFIASVEPGMQLFPKPRPWNEELMLRKRYQAKTEGIR